MVERIIIVNEKDEPIGVKNRSLVQLEDIYRVSALWVENDRGEVLLARRAYSKNHDPGKWGPAVAGTVADGEAYEDNIKKEAKEELGLENLVFRSGPKCLYNSEHKFFVQWFISEINMPINFFRPDNLEVAEIIWISKTDLSNLLKNHPDEFVASAKIWPEIFSL